MPSGEGRFHYYGRSFAVLPVVRVRVRTMIVRGELAGEAQDASPPGL